MDVTPEKTKTLASKLKENMGKLVLTIVFLSGIVVLVTYAVEGRSEGDQKNSTENGSLNSNTNSDSANTNILSTNAPIGATTARYEANQPELRPPGQLLNASSWSADTLRTGNGSVLVDKGIYGWISIEFIFNVEKK